MHAEVKIIQRWFEIKQTIVKSLVSDIPMWFGKYRKTILGISNIRGVEIELALLIIKFVYGLVST